MQIAKPCNRIPDGIVEDLLGRGQASSDPTNLREHIGGKAVLVTGAAGSIGSELCRQIAGLGPLVLVGFDQAETPLFQLGEELKQKFPQSNFRTELAGITRPDDIHRTMNEYKPSIVFHAAAYKHVPMMERHAFAAVENNAFGTIKVAQAAAESEVESFVLISTDKAVRPASVLGVTKRVAELTICALQKKHGTKFVAVRFGNVLGSSGSVVPIFMGQIENGGPVTVTHPEMRRYFMTASEAVQLVLQASVLGKGGEVFVLNMGEPVRIVDLARSLIVSSGLEPDRDIRIEFTGMRPGEKLFEELTFDNERLSATVHPKIFSLVRAQLADAADVSELLHELRQSLDARNLSQMILLLKKLVPDYVPSCELPCGMMPGESDSSSVEVIEPSCGEVREGEQVSALPEEETAVCAARGRS